MRIHLLSVVLVCLAASVAFAGPLIQARIDDEDARSLARQLELAGFDVLEGSVTDTSLEVIVSEAEFAILEEQGYAPVKLAVGRPFSEIQEERRAGTRVPGGYLTLTEIVAAMNNTAASFPSICQLVDLTTTLSVSPTFEGRHLYAVKISDNVTQDEDERAVLIVGAHHCREIVTPVIALYAIQQLTAQYGTDPQVTAAVDDHEIWIAPVWNPDGYEYVFNVDNMWRKNRYPFPGGIGVDLNRNYPFGWDSACSGSTDPSTQTYKGPSPGSEAETQTMLTLSLDRRFAKVLDYHSSGREALWAYACLSHPFDSFLQQEAAALSTASGYGGATRGPSADGEHYQWQLGAMAAHAFLLETHTEFQPLYASAQAEAALVWPGILWMIERPVPLWGYATDAVTGGPVEASISHPGVAFANGETNSSGPNGRYHAFLPAGTYDVTFDADGYDLATADDVVVSASASARHDVALHVPPQLLSPNGGETLPVGMETTVTWGGDAMQRFQVQYTSNYGDIEYISEGFESGTLDPAFITGGDAPWFVTTTFPLLGQYAARAGAISHNQQSWMTRNVFGGDASFWYHVSSEAGHDFFNFYVDGGLEVHASGLGGWSQYSTTLPPGPHELKWEYTKDSMTSAGNDSVWIDLVEIVSDSTAWTDIVALTAPGVTSAPWTPTETTPEHKVRVRAYYDPGYFGVWDESDAMFEIVPVPADGDFDGDGNVDLDDYTAFSDCLSGPDTSPDPTPPVTTQECLDAFDFDVDTDLDLFDFAAFQEVFTGA